MAQYLIPLAVTVALCYKLFASIDVHQMMAIIREQCDFTYILIGMAISVLSHVFRAMRWGIQLAAIGVRPPLFVLVLSIFGTYAVNLVFPRLGEVWRTGYIAQRQKAQFASVFGSMVGDRLADLVTVLCLTLLAFVLASGAIMTYCHDNATSLDGLRHVLTSPWWWIAFAVLALALWWFMTRRSGNKVVVRIQTAIRQLWQGFAALATMRHKWLWLLLTVGIWGCFFVQMYVAFFAFPFTAEVAQTDGLTAVLVTFVLSSIAMGVPSNGGIGPWQWAVIFALGIYGVDATSAGAFANLVLGCQTLLLIALGVFTFVCVTIDSRRLRRAANAPSNNDNQQLSK